MKEKSHYFFTNETQHFQFPSEKSPTQNARTGIPSTQEKAHIRTRNSVEIKIFYFSFFLVVESFGCGNLSVCKDLQEENFFES
jgi:hypothetical protein